MIEFKNEYLVICKYSVNKKCVVSTKLIGCVGLSCHVPTRIDWVKFLILKDYIVLVDEIFEKTPEEMGLKSG